jgi:toxin YhaV
MDVATRNGWQLYVFAFFLNTLKELVSEVKKQQANNPADFYNHPSMKMLTSIRKTIIDDVPMNPAAGKFQQGKTLGKDYKHWRRVKNGLPDRYRLFFRFNSETPKSIIYAWINDESTLRKAGAKTDVYTVFKRYLDQGKVPDTWKTLLEESSSDIPIEA